jgi:WD40 repeat protein
MFSMSSRIALLILLAVCVSAPGDEPSPEPPRPRITPDNLAKLRELPTLEREAWRIVPRHDGKQIAVVRWEKPVEILDPDRLRPVSTFGKGKVIDFVFSKDSDVVAYSLNGGGAFIQNLGTKKEFKLDVGDSQASLAFSPDGKHLVTGTYGGGAKLWNTKTGRLVRTFDTGQTQGGLTPVFSPDGKVLAIGNRNSTTRLFDPATGKLLHTLDRKMTHGLAFSPNGKMLAATYVDGSIVLWDVSTGKWLDGGKSGAEELFCVDWSPSGDLLVTAGLRGTVVLWSPKGLKALKSLKAAEAIFTIRFTPDGSRLLAGGGSQSSGGERKVWVWGLR